MIEPVSYRKYRYEYWCTRRTRSTNSEKDEESYKWETKKSEYFTEAHTRKVKNAYKIFFNVLKV
jgi:hypothetical protein